MEVDGAAVNIVVGPNDIATITETTDLAGNVTGLNVEAVQGTITVNDQPLAPGGELGVADLAGAFSVSSGGFQLNALLTLAPSRDPLGPTLEGIIRLEVGTWTSGNIAASLFKVDKYGRYKYVAIRNGVGLELVLGPLGSITTVRAIGKRTGFKAFAAPLNAIELAVDDDVGVMDL